MLQNNQFNRSSDSDNLPQANDSHVSTKLTISTTSLNKTTWDHLLALPKQFKENVKSINLSDPIIRLVLCSPDDDSYEFLFQCKRSLKADFKISLHHQENNNIIHLLRVDYNGGHKNPETLNEHVPEILKPYCGVQINESHIHFNVEGYKELAWAIPLNAYDNFKIKDITNAEQYSLAIHEFMKMINLTSNFTIEVPLLL